MNRERSGTYIPLITAAMALLGGFGGGYLTHHYTSSREKHSSLVEVRSRAYTEFFQGQSLLWSALDESERANANRVIGNAKLQVVMAGSGDVIHTMVQFWDRSSSYPPCDPPQKFEEDARIYQSIRNETFRLLGLGEPEIAPQVLVPFVFNCKLPGTRQSGRSK